MGLELGQSNAAWMLEHGFGPGHLPQSVHMALGLYKWSAEQENTNSLLAVGDIFFYGRGIQKDWNRSSGVYQLAEKQKSSRAAFNLGFMHQYGAGVPKDPHLAKRSPKITLTFSFLYADTTIWLTRTTKIPFTHVNLLWFTCACKVGGN